MVSTSQKFWKKVIDRFYEKYKGWELWHIKLMQEATSTGSLVMPTGRVYKFTQTAYGDWPRTCILNYPVQGLGADAMAIIRVAFYKRGMAKGFPLDKWLISSVHDSIVVDCPSRFLHDIAKLFNEVFADFPKLFKQWFGVEFNLPLKCEISYGPNMADLVEYKG